MQRDSYQVLLNYAFWLLGRRSYSEAELFKKLKRRCEFKKLANGERATKKVLKRLKELNYVDDDQIIGNYFEYRLKARPIGKFRFLHEMRKRGISFEKAREEWEKRDIDEEELAFSLANKKMGKFAKLPLLLKKKKIAALLASRGFGAETVWGVLDKIEF